MNARRLAFFTSAFKGTAAMAASPPRFKLCLGDFGEVNPQASRQELLSAFPAAADVHEFRIGEDDPKVSVAAD